MHGAWKSDEQIEKKVSRISSTYLFINYISFILFITFLGIDFQNKSRIDEQK